MSDSKQDGSIIVTEVKEDGDVVELYMPKGQRVVEDTTDAVDAVFGALDESTQSYRSVTSFGAFALITKANIGLGVLSIPLVFHVIGIVPGVILIIFMGSIVGSTMIGSVKLKHPEVYGIADAAYVFGGRWAKEAWYLFFWLYCLVAVSGSLVSLSAALNAVSSHAACTAVWIGVIAVAGLALGFIPTLSRVSWIGWVGLVFLISALLTLTISVGVQPRPADAPRPPAAWDRDIRVVGHPNFGEAMWAISSVSVRSVHGPSHRAGVIRIRIFASVLTDPSFNVVSEMRDPRAYTRVLIASISITTVLYLVLGGVVCAFCGQYISSPALGSAGPLMKKVCYGLAIPALGATLTIFVHLGGKHIFVRVLSGSHHLTHSTKTHWIVWSACVFSSAFLGYIIASAIPDFGSFVGLFGALVNPAVAIVPYGAMWWHDNWRPVKPEQRTLKLWALLALNIFITFTGLFITVAGTYGAVIDLIKSSASGGPWSCKDNSGGS
ncbi:N amino acid transport system protein [Vanrija pseudolonga]|uniref:N amino acid transport system protein n=1 Tax=Vanrija pseudolonga TaxID=143232 RepID=A0AAF0Y9T9_9TREE|nr:N amino acid transport system protein [Vanrija pseudolonga]